LKATLTIYHHNHQGRMLRTHHENCLRTYIDMNRFVLVWGTHSWSLCKRFRYILYMPGIRMRL
jgi:hypothetical protein